MRKEAGWHLRATLHTFTFLFLQIVFEPGEELERFQARQEGVPLASRKSKPISKDSLIDQNPQQLDNELDVESDQGDDYNEAAIISCMEEEALRQVILQAIQLPTTDAIRETLLNMASKVCFLHKGMPIMQDFWALQMALQIDRCVQLFRLNSCILPIASASADHSSLAETMMMYSSRASLSVACAPAENDPTLWSQTCSHCKDCTYNLNHPDHLAAFVRDGDLYNRPFLP
jgi:hypothetical protein